MKSLFFLEILMISQREKRARAVTFNPTMTLITGKNDTGKSSLVKSIFRAFGADPVSHPRWKSANVSTLVKFCVNDNNYSILHDGEHRYSLFDNDDKLIRSFRSVSKELAPYLASLFEFELRLPNKQNYFTVPPPAYFFLPFYIDQDRSWSESWNSFNGLSQFSNWKKQLAEYHTGIRPNEYYQLLIEKNSVGELVQKTASELYIQRNILRKLDEKFKIAEFSLNLDDFKKEVDELLSRCAELKNYEQDLKINLTKLNNIRIHLKTQIQLVKNTLSEIEKDFEFTSSELQDDVECPTCGATYENSFIERFSIAQDENRCMDFLKELELQYTDIEEKIEKTKKDFHANSFDLGKITEILEIKKNEIKLKEILDNQGKIELRNMLKNEIILQQDNLVKSERQLEILKKEIGQFNKEERRKEILDKYYQFMRRFLYSLDVHGLKEANYKNINSSINETGSDLPRALLAYYYSILHLIHMFSNKVFCPIVIDSPNQQDQDPESLQKMISFIVSNLPGNTQLILCATDVNMPLNLPYKEIKLDNKDFLLTEKEYAAVFFRMKPFMQQSLFNI